MTREEYIVEPDYDPTDLDSWGDPENFTGSSFNEPKESWIEYLRRNWHWIKSDVRSVKLLIKEKVEHPHCMLRAYQNDKYLLANCIRSMINGLVQIVQGILTVLSLGFISGELSSDYILTTFRNRK